MRAPSYCLPSPRLSQTSLSCTPAMIPASPPATATSAGSVLNNCLVLLFVQVVGFEVSPCSIKREAGKPVEDTLCGVDDNWDVEPQARSKLASQTTHPGSSCANVVYTLIVLALLCWWRQSCSHDAPCTMGTRTSVRGSVPRSLFASTALLAEMAV